MNIAVMWRSDAKHTRVEITTNKGGFKRAVKPERQGVFQLRYWHDGQLHRRSCTSGKNQLLRFPTARIKHLADQEESSFGQSENKRGILEKLFFPPGKIAIRSTSRVAHRIP
jgi:hypothetical protein